MERSRAILNDTGPTNGTAAAPAHRTATHTHRVLALQQMVGNRAVQRLIENGLEAASPEDSPSGIVNEVLDAPGQALDPKTRALMESSFGADFGGVRIHTDTRASESAGAIQARAYTSGQNVVFGEGRYEPETVEGQRLLAHELTHVVQQAAGPVAGTLTSDGGLSISDPEDAFEQAADAQASQVIEGGAAEAPVAGSGAPTRVSVQRSWLDDVGDFVSDAGSAVASGVSSVVDAGESVASDVASGVSNVASDVWSGAKSVAGDVASGVSDVASDVWSGAKTVAGDVADFGKGVYGQMKEDAGYVQKGVGYVDKGIDWLEDEAKGGTHWLADKAKGIPVLEQLAGAGESYVDTSVDVAGGALKGVTGMASGLLSAAADPVDTAKALYTMSEHIPGIGAPAKLLSGAYDLATGDKSLSDVADETLNPMSDLKYWGNVGKGIWSPMQQSIDAGKPGEALGQAGIQILAMLGGEGEVGAAGEAAEGAEGAEVAEGAETAEAGEGAEAAEATEAGSAAATGSQAGGAWNWIKNKIGDLFGGESKKPPPMSEEDQIADEFLKEQQKKPGAPTDEELNDVEWVRPEPGGGYGKPGPGNWKPNMDPDSLWKRRRGW